MALMALKEVDPISGFDYMQGPKTASKLLEMAIRINEIVRWINAQEQAQAEKRGTTK